MKPSPKQPTLQERGISTLVRDMEIGRGARKYYDTYMQKKGDISDESARARTLKYVARYVDQVPLEHESVQLFHSQ